MKENWFALYLAIKKNMSSGKAITAMGLKLPQERLNWQELTRIIDINTLVEQHKTMSYYKLAEIYHVPAMTLRDMVLKHQRKAILS
jgi:hypothetical protein